MTDEETITGRNGELYVWHPDRVIGRGGYSVVCEAETIAKLPLAMKVVQMPDSATGRRYAEARRGGREIDIARRLDPSHDIHLMPIRDDFLIDDDRFALIMPRAQRSLAQTIAQDGPLAEDAAKLLLADMLAGLEQLARASVAHRDIKPANTLWWNERWVLADFGIARILDDDTGTLTWAGHGTQMYWAPELFDADPTSALTDLYATGCTVFETLTGHAPFPRSRLAEAHRYDQPLLPEMHDANFDRVLRLLMAKDPEGRPPDARTARQMLLPTGTMSSAQTRLQQLAARSVRSAQASAIRARQDELTKQRRASALARLSVIWDSLTALTSAALPEAESLVQAGGYFLTVQESRLNVTTTAPDDPDLPLLVGEVVVRHLDVQTLVYAANLVCHFANGKPDWQIATFTPNGLRRDAPRLPAGIGGRGAGVAAAEAVRLLAAAKKPAAGMHIPPVILQSEPLTAEALLELFVEATETISP